MEDVPYSSLEKQYADAEAAVLAAEATAPLALRTWRLLHIKAVSEAIDAAGVGGDAADSMKRTVFGFLGSVPSGVVERSAARQAVIAVIDRLRYGSDSVGQRHRVLEDAENRLCQAEIDFSLEYLTRSKEKGAISSRWRSEADEKFLALSKAVTEAKMAYNIAFFMSLNVETLLTRCDRA